MRTTFRCSEVQTGDKMSKSVSLHCANARIPAVIEFENLSRAAGSMELCRCSEDVPDWTRWVCTDCASK
jgi:hypothetical protein